MAAAKLRDDKLAREHDLEQSRQQNEHATADKLESEDDQITLATEASWDTQTGGGVVKPRIAGVKAENGGLDTTTAVAVATAAVVAQTWVEWGRSGGMLGLIFGGCCSNVFALESIIKPHPGAGLLITLTQFLHVSLINLPSHLRLSRPSSFPYLPVPTLKPSTIPLASYLPPILLFFLTNALNNLAFSYRISVPVHIILRSGGSVTTMLVGYVVAGKRYTRLQVVSVAMITVGVAIAALSDAQSKGNLTSGTTHGRSFATGLAIILLAQLLSALMGLNTQSLYGRYGAHTASEFLFYSHLLSLPLFLPFLPSILASYRHLASSPPLTVSIPPALRVSSLLGERTALAAPSALVALAANALTQYACISGVNLLSARSSALTVTVVLNVRKLVSLVLSVLVFGEGQGLELGVAVGAGWVFGGGGVYGWAVGMERRDKAVVRTPRERKTAGGEKEL